MKTINILLGSVVLMSSIFSSCSKDEEPVKPKMKKMTSVVCTEENQDIPCYTAQISYASTGLNRIVLTSAKDDLTGTKKNTYLYLYDNDGITVTRTTQEGDAFLDRRYVLSSGYILKEELHNLNPYNGNEDYISDLFSFQYQQSQLKSISQLMRWPNKTGSGYQERTYPNICEYRWEEQNATLLTSDKTELVVEYGGELQPDNFTFRLHKSLDLVEWNVFNPINFLYARNSRNLPVRAYSYTIPNINQKNAEYQFNYVLIGGYVTTMQLMATYYKNGVKEETKIYKYAFEYNYEE